jgi:membrane-bound lytic murein transglycosylase A
MRGRIVTSAKGPPRVVPYGDRTEIEDQTPVKPLVWVDDPVDAFFLEIQGSGRVRLEDGSVLRVGYSDQNGHPYYPIGRELIRRGALQAGSATAPAIRDWLRTHPLEARSVMATNPSFVFFRELPPPREVDEGPPGALGVPLTPTRSAAIDPKALPLGTMLYVSTNHPGREGALERTVVAQDTGGAIRGPVRADFFWGFDAVDGQSAADLAGRMRSNGRLWLLWPRGETPP